MAEKYVLTVMIGQEKPYDIVLEDIEADGGLTFGRNEQNDVVLASPIVSSVHGKLFIQNGQLHIADYGSRNGTYVRSVLVDPNKPVALYDGDTITFESEYMRDLGLVEEGVLLLLSQRDDIGEDWTVVRLSDKPILIGRGENCQIRLPRVNVSQVHARLVPAGKGFRVEDKDSTNGVFVNGRRVTRSQPLSERDAILVGGVYLLYAHRAIHYQREKPRVHIRVLAAEKTVHAGSGKRKILNDVSLAIPNGSFTAIIGGSGAGKSTLMNGICGSSRFTSGQVLYNGQNLYTYYDALKAQIGYVPQQDIVYADLTVRKMLLYTARLRMPNDATRKEMEERVDAALDAVELTEHQHTLIGRLSGGQRKRASIAVELVNDPDVFFLDEPTSGLDPGTERHLMQTLKAMTAQHRTVVTVTHMTANVSLCDQLIVMGTGGRLCFTGTPKETLQFFEVDDFTDIYDKINQDAEAWQRKFEGARSDNLPVPHGEREQEGSEPGYSANKHPFFRQVAVLCGRFFALLAADPKRLLMLLLQAPLLGALLCLTVNVSDGSSIYTDAKVEPFVFALSCVAFWLGVLGAIQEICKERDIYRRERMAGLKLMPYLLSKVISLGGLCMVQCALIMAAVIPMCGLPSQVTELVLPPMLYMFVALFLTAFSAMALGLAASCVSPTPDRAMSLAPILLMPQILLSGVAFTDLSGVMKSVSYFISCKWSVWSFKLMVNINEVLPDMYDTAFMLPGLSAWGLLKPWIMLLGLAVMCVGLCVFALSINDID